TTNPFHMLRYKLLGHRHTPPSGTTNPFHMLRYKLLGHRHTPPSATTNPFHMLRYKLLGHRHTSPSGTTNSHTAADLATQPNPWPIRFASLSWRLLQHC